MKHFLLLAVSAVMLAVVGWNLYQRAETKIARNSRVQANIDAITTPTSNEKDANSGSNTPPEPWHYVPNAKITPEVKQFKLTCFVDGHLNVDGKGVSGDFQYGRPYSIVVKILDCENRTGAWCDQRQISVAVIHVTPM